MKYTLPLLMLAALLQGCVTAPRQERLEPVVLVPQTQAVQLPMFEASPDPLAEQKLREVGELYDRGDYNRVVLQLNNNRDVWYGTVAQRLQGHKLLAFSYCLTKRQALCEQQFSAAVRLDPQFDLKLAERNHPQWGPAFEKAKGSVLVQIDRSGPNQSRSTWSPSQAGTGSSSGSSNSGISINVNPGGVESVKLPQSIPVRIN